MIDAIVICTFVIIIGNGAEALECPSSDYFQCANGDCIAMFALCDGSNDCLDKSDEVNCTSLMYSTSKGVYHFYLEQRELLHQNHQIVSAKNARAVSSNSNFIYWSRANDSKIMKHPRWNHDLEYQLIAVSGVNRPEEIVVDWLTGNIYFIDGILKYIGVCEQHGKHCTMIICSQTGIPHSLALFPTTGELFWTTKAEISVSEMNGKNPKVLVSENLANPISLTIDYPSKRLYWIDGSKIESVNLDGTNRKLMFTNKPRIDTIAFLSETFFWLDDEQRKSIHFKKKDGKNGTLFTAKSPISRIYIDNTEYWKNVANPCAERHCSHLCLLGRAGNVSCACGFGHELTKNQKSCHRKSEQKYLVVVASDDVYFNYYHPIVGKAEFEAFLTPRPFDRLVYDSTTGSYLGNTPHANLIFRFDSKTSNVSPVLKTKSPTVAGMDFDFYGNNIYVSREQSIDVYNLETGKSTTKKFKDKKPRDMVVVPELATMYVVFEVEGKFSIEKLPMTLSTDGQVVVKGLLGPKVSLALDESQNKIYYADESPGELGAIFVDSDEKFTIRSGLAGIESLAVLDGIIFWTRRGSKGMLSIDTRDPFLDVAFVEVLSTQNITKLVTVVRRKAEKKHPCRLLNGGCSHVCLVAKTSTSVNGTLCACPSGITHNRDDPTCGSNNFVMSKVKECSDCYFMC